jgi:DNA-directed RNA polymerase II subunit RPB9
LWNYKLISESKSIDLMATPTSTTSHDGIGRKKNEQITFRFCSECSNMLYPKEDEESHRLQFTCRTCQYTEEAQSTCVFRNILNNSAGETAGVTQDVGSDPTVGSPLEDLPLCEFCGEIVICIKCGEVHKPATLALLTKSTCLPDGTHSGYGLSIVASDYRDILATKDFLDLSSLADPFMEYDEEPQP